LCVKSKIVVCSSSKTYMLKVDEKCVDDIIKLIEKRGRITARFGPLIKGVYVDAPITIIKPDKVQVMLLHSKLSIDDIVRDFNSIRKNE